MSRVLKCDGINHEITSHHMTYSEIRNAITQRTGERTFFERYPGGPALGVPALEDGMAHFSLVPIDDESRAEFVDFLVNLTGKPASASRPYPYNEKVSGG